MLVIITPTPPKYLSQSWIRIERFLQRLPAEVGKNQHGRHRDRRRDVTHDVQNDLPFLARQSQRLLQNLPHNRQFLGLVLLQLRESVSDGLDINDDDSVALVDDHDIQLTASVLRGQVSGFGEKHLGLFARSTRLSVDGLVEVLFEDES